MCFFSVTTGYVWGLRRPEPVGWVGGGGGDGVLQELLRHGVLLPPRGPRPHRNKHKYQQHKKIPLILVTAGSGHICTSIYTCILAIYILAKIMK